MRVQVLNLDAKHRALAWVGLNMGQENQIVFYCNRVPPAPVLPTAVPRSRESVSSMDAPAQYWAQYTLTNLLTLLVKYSS